MAEQDQEQQSSAAEPEVSDARRKLVGDWCQKVKDAKYHWKETFDRMREDMRFAKGKQWSDQGKNDPRYIANIVKRHLHQRTAALYAKDPKAVARRRERMDFEIWNGDTNQLLAAWQQIQMAMQQGQDPRMAMPQQMALIQDFQQGSQTRTQMDRVAKTLEILFHYFLGQQRFGFKRQMKQMVRRALTTGVGYIKLGFQRELERDPHTESRLEDITERLAYVERLMVDAQEGDMDPMSAEAEQLRLTIEELQEQVEVVIREGLVFDFPQSTAIIPDPKTRSIEGGFIGADWIAEEFQKTPEEIEEIYGVDIGSRYERYQDPGAPEDEPERAPKRDDAVNKGKGLATLWEIYDRKSGLKYAVVEGYPDFLEDPEPPYPLTDRFFPIYPLTFNQTEDEDDPFPLSDVHELIHIQKEYNRAKEALRQHRIANRPLYVGPAGVLENKDQRSLANHAAHAFIPLQGLQPGQNIGHLLQPVQKVPIDPNLYEVSTLYNDLLRVSGDQEANLGGTSKATAFEVGVAEQSRVSSITSNIDDMDELLSEVSRDAGKVLILEMSVEQVMQIVGPGAVWPELTREQLAEELLLEIEAGSSGRPNRTQQIANFERVAPFLMQIPGISPQWMAEYVLKILDDKLDIKDAIIAGLPSMVAMNGMQQASTGDASTDPAAQGPAGGRPAQPGPAPGQPGPTGLSGAI